MKSISKFISLALLIAAATACNTKEIDKPDIPDQPQISGNVKFTASMKQTRVEYSVNGEKLHQRWEVDDFIYGFYGDNPVGKVTLKVTEVDEDTEQATLEATDETEGAAFIAAIKEKGTKLNVGLLYTGRNNESVSGNTIYASMQNQSTGKIPAYLVGHLDEIAKDEESGDTFVYFDFENECAILEIQSLTGIKETIDLESIEISGVEIITSFEYSSGSFSISSTLSTSVRVSGSLKVDSNGNIVDAAGNRSCIRIAVKATSLRLSTSTEITVTATANDASSTEYSSSYKGVLHPGCYIICAKDVVAKTEDGFYFTTVKAAFDHAAELFSANKYDSEHNIVTLVKGCSFGDDDINIDGYDVILDLNGKTLSQDGEGMFYVQYNGNNGASNNPSSFTIRDSKVSGKIDGQNDYWIVYNYGVLNIESGSLDAVEDTQTIYNKDSGTINITGGELSCINWPVIDNHGETTITGGTISVDEKCVKGTCEVINNSGTLTIDGGTITSAPNLVAIANPGTLKINGGTISSKNGIAVSTWGTATITGGNITSTNGYALNTNSSDTYPNSSATITGGKISSTNNYAVYAAGGAVNISQGNGELCEISSTASDAGAILLLDTEATISGGTIMSNGKATIDLMNQSSLVVSGGKIICTGPASDSDDFTSSAIECRCGGEESSLPLLTVKWPEEGYDSNRKEPLLYSMTDAPISEMSSVNEKYFKVTLQGGFLYTGAEEGVFYKQKQTQTTYKTLQVSSDYGFYSNSTGMTRVQYVGCSVISLDPSVDIDNIPEVTTTLSFSYQIKITEKTD